MAGRSDALLNILHCKAKYFHHLPAGMLTEM
jgi:hypothetical protein